MFLDKLFDQVTKSYGFHGRTLDLTPSAQLRKRTEILASCQRKLKV